MTDRFRSQAKLCAAQLDLPLDPTWLDGIAASLDLLAGHAALVMAVPLRPDIEPAPVFVP